MKHIKLLSLILVLSLLFASVVFANELGADNLFDEEITKLQNDIDQIKQGIQRAPNKEVADSWKQGSIGMELYIKKLQEYKANVIKVGDEDTIQSYLEDVVGRSQSGFSTWSVPGLSHSYFPFHGVVVSKRSEDEHGLVVVSGMDDNVGNKKADYIFEPNQVDDFIKLLEDIVKNSTTVDLYVSDVNLYEAEVVYFPIYQEFMGQVTVPFEEGRAQALYVFSNHNEIVIFTTKQYGNNYIGAPTIVDRIVVKIPVTKTPEENEITEQKPDPEPTPDPEPEPDPDSQPEQDKATSVIPVVIVGTALLLGAAGFVVRKRVKVYAINDSGRRFLKSVPFRIQNNELIINIKNVIGMKIDIEKELAIDIPKKYIDMVLENADKERFIVIQNDKVEVTRIKIKNTDQIQKYYTITFEV